MRIDLPFRRLLSVYFTLFMVITVALVYWQVASPATQAQQLVASSYNPRHCVQDAIPYRGRILDRNGVVLAYSRPDNSAPCGWRRYYDTPSHPEYKKAIESLAPLLGYFDPQGYGVTGMELAYNDILSGETPDQSSGDISTDLQNTLNQAEHIQTFGTDVYLTIDITIQKKALESFESIEKIQSGSSCSSSQRGSVIVEDPHTGEMLAMVSHPGFDNEKLVDHTPAGDGAGLTVGQEYFQQLLQDPNKPLIARPVASTIVPGSSFKTLTLLAAYDSGQFSPGSTFTQDEASDYVVDGFDFNVSNLEDYTNGPEPPSFPLDLTHAYAYSDNVALARVAVAIGKDTYLNYAQRLGLSYGNHVTNIPFDLPVAHSWVFQPQFQSEWDQDNVALAATGFGQGRLLVSPLEESVVTSAVAADGQYFKPHLLLKSVPHDNTNPATVPSAAPQDLGQVFSAAAAQGVREGMRGVVVYGSVGASGGIISAMKNSSALIGGKTGSGQLNQTATSDSWFISVAPDDVNNPSGDPPKLSIVVEVENGGSGACHAPIVQSIFEYALPKLNAGA